MNNRNIIIVIFISIVALISLFFLLLKGTLAASTADRIHFTFTYSFSEATSAEGILIESNGHYGLIDTGNPSCDYIGIGSSVSSGYPNGYAYNTYNGKTIKEYIRSLNSNAKLDFVLLTHAHSDHVGGVPDLYYANCNSTAADSNPLIDSNTVLFYKEYSDGSVSDPYLNHTQEFYNKAISTMRAAGSYLFNVENHTTSDMTTINNSNRYINDLRYVNNNVPSDYVEFAFGDFNIKVFNLQQRGVSENYNSLVVLVSKGSQKTLLMSESNSANDVQYNIARTVGEVSLLKAGHYGYNRYIDMSLFDITKPEKLIITTSSGHWSHSSYEDDERVSAIAYMNEKNGKVIANEDFNYPFVADVLDNSIVMYKTNNGNFTQFTSSDYSSNTIDTGWYRISDRSNYSYTYVSNNQLKYGWLKYNNKWYYLNKMKDDVKVSKNNSVGTMLTGWIKVDGYWYYLNPDTSDGGAMLTGWQKIGGKWYYLASSGDANGYKEGAMYESICAKVDSVYYCFDSDGVMENKTNIAGVVDPPTSSYCKDITYDGNEHVLTYDPDTDDYTFSGNRATNPGTYTITAKLSKSNYQWKNNASGNITFTCTIKSGSSVNTDSYTFNKRTSISSIKSEMGLSSAVTVKVYRNNNEITTGGLSTNDIIKTYRNGSEIGNYVSIVKGEVTGDGEIDMNDVFKIYNHHSNKKIIIDQNLLAAAEITHDDKVDMNDVYQIYRYHKKLITSFN